MVSQLMDPGSNIQTQAVWPQICPFDHCGKLALIESELVPGGPLASFDTENQFSQLLHIL